MREVLRVDERDHVAVVQAGVTIRELNERLAGTGLHYPVYPGELSGSLGGNVNTNAGGMRAVRHGVTRHHVLGLEIVLMDGTVLRTGGPVVKSSSGYDLTQLIVGSEGHARARHRGDAQALAGARRTARRCSFPSTSSGASRASCPPLISSGLAPSTARVPRRASRCPRSRRVHRPQPRRRSRASPSAARRPTSSSSSRRERPSSSTPTSRRRRSCSPTPGALEVYVLEGISRDAAHRSPREGVLARQGGAARTTSSTSSCRDRAVPQVPSTRSTTLADRYGAFIAGCGHVGDGNVHLSVYLADDEQRRELLLELFRAGVALGGAISGEHGLGVDKRAAYLELADPALVDLQRRIKAVFDPEALLNPYRHLDPREDPSRVHRRRHARRRQRRMSHSGARAMA